MDAQGGFAREVANEVAKATPAVAITGATLFGLPLDEIAKLIVLALTAVYVVYQIRFLRWKWKRAKSMPPQGEPDADP